MKYEVYSTPQFEADYTYTGDDLGAVWTAEKTCFRLWAPTAQEVTINLYPNGDTNSQAILRQIPMQRDVCGTWVAQETGNLNGLYYTYLVMVDGQINEACDPYARTTGINGERAMILDLQSTNPRGWEKDRDPHAGSQITDAVIYELHVRDFSMNRGSPFRHKGKYLAFAETKLKTRGGIPIGLEYIQSLGVTHVHLLPVFDFGYTDETQRRPQYNWGYDPVNFNVPEGSYSTNPRIGAIRVRELKRLVKSLHDAGLSVVMDVVYNHVYNEEDFCFNRIVPGYFSRISPDGTYSNGSACGRELLGR